MRINYDLNFKTYFTYWNTAKGICLDKEKIKKHPQKRIKKWTTHFFSVILMWTLLIPCIAFFDSFVHLTWITYLLAILLIGIPIQGLIRLCYTIYCFFKKRKLWKKGEMVLSKNGMDITNDSGNILTKNWYEMDFFYRGENVLFLITRKNDFFMIPKSYGEQKELLSQIVNDYPHIKIIDPIILPEIGFFKKQFLNWGKYILLFFILMIIDVEWEEKNILILNNEIEKIDNLEVPVDSSIYAYQKYALVEEELKKFFIPLKRNFLIYNENNATNTTSFLTSDYLKNNRNTLKNLIKEFENRKQVTENAIIEIVKLLENVNDKTNIQKLELGEKYENLYQEYLNEFMGEQYKEQWKKEIENNRIRMEYLKEMINILTLPNACWSIEDDHLYFCDESQLKEYNRLYDLVMDEKKPSTGIKF